MSRAPLPAAATPAAGLFGRSRRRLWVAVAGLLLVAGTTGSMLAASSVADKSADRARATFTRAAAHVASTLQLAIQHQEDLTYSATGFINGHPLATSAVRTLGGRGQGAAALPRTAGPGRGRDRDPGRAAGVRAPRGTGRLLRRVPARRSAVLLLLGQRFLPHRRQPASRRVSTCVPWRRRSRAGRPRLRPRRVHPVRRRAGHDAGRALPGLSRRPAADHGGGAARGLHRLGRAPSYGRRDPARALEDQPGLAVSFSYRAHGSAAGLHQRDGAGRCPQRRDRPAQRVDGSDVRHRARARRVRQPARRSPCCSAASP